MPDPRALLLSLDEIGISYSSDSLGALLATRLADEAHGDLPVWRAVVAQLPRAPESCIGQDVRAVDISGPHLQHFSTDVLRQLLMQLSPWRKGPFRIQGIDIDTEWRSDLKWDRVADAVAPLQGRQILDVGSGNGFYALKMLQAGADSVIGIDPTLLFVCQFAALRKLSGCKSAQVLPLRLHELPFRPGSFDTTFSMGVLYHQRNPQEHLAQLHRTLRGGGELLLETLVLPGEEKQILQPDNRYARMRNVWHLPTVPLLLEWLGDAGFSKLQLVDVTQTTVGEQRTTEWMPFESLAEALDPRDPTQTIEGLPAPTRAIIVGKKA